MGFSDGDRYAILAAHLNSLTWYYKDGRLWGAVYPNNPLYWDSKNVGADFAYNPEEVKDWVYPDGSPFMMSDWRYLNLCTNGKLTTSECSGPGCCDDLYGDGVEFANKIIWYNVVYPPYNMKKAQIDGDVLNNTPTVGSYWEAIGFPTQQSYLDFINQQNRIEGMVEQEELVRKFTIGLPENLQPYAGGETVTRELYEIHIKTPINPELPTFIISRIRDIGLRGGWEISSIFPSTTLERGYTIRAVKTGSITAILLISLVVAVLALIGIGVISWAVVRVSDNKTQETASNNAQKVLSDVIGYCEANGLTPEECEEFKNGIISTYENLVESPDSSSEGGILDGIGGVGVAIGLVVLALVLGNKK